METKEVAIQGIRHDPSVFIMTAIEKGIGPEQLKQFIDLKERYDANEARKAYVVAMAGFKSEPLEIFKDVNVKFDTKVGKTSYNHAGLDTAVEKINIPLSKHGLVAAWNPSTENGQITVECFLTHILGHREMVKLSGPPDATGSKNALQAIGSTISYLERYTLFAILGISAKGQDDDGKGAGKEAETITEEQYVNIVAMFKNKERQGRYEKFLKTKGIDGIGNMPSCWYEQAVKDITKSEKNA